MSETNMATSEANITVFTKTNIQALERRPIDQTRYSTTFVMLVTWSLAAAFGVAFWTLLLYYGIPTIPHIAPAILHFIQRHYPHFALHSAFA